MTSMSQVLDIVKESADAVLAAAEADAVERQRMHYAGTLAATEPVEAVVRLDARRYLTCSMLLPEGRYYVNHVGTNLAEIVSRNTALLLIAEAASRRVLARQLERADEEAARLRAAMQ